MAQEFHLKLITERAAGGDPIIRERHVPGPELTIGRSPDSNIVLTDLSVDLKHAVVRFTGPGRVTLESVSGQPFKVAGRSTSRIDLNVANLPKADFGEYSLAFEPGPEGGATIVVTREEAHHASPSVFSLRAPIFGRRNMAWVLGAGIFLICLLVPLIATGWLSHAKIHPDQQWSTGPLSKSHAFLENDCKSCHANAFVAVKDETCLSCHKAGDPATEQKALARSKDLGSPFTPILAADHAPNAKLRKALPLPGPFIPKVSTLVQRTFNHPTDRCASCHVEHTKPGAIADKRMGAKADPHAPLADKPTMVVVEDCEGCHTGLKKRLGKDAQLVDTPSWERHPAFSPLVMTNAAGPKPMFQRMALAAPTKPVERNGLIFPHRMHLDRQGGVARQAIDLGKAGGYGAPLECVTCHVRDASGKAFQPITMEKACGACHSLAYARVGGELKFLPHGELQKVIDTMSGRTLTGSPGSDRQRPGMIRPSAFAASGASAYRATFSKGGTCFDCHTITWSGDTVQMAPVKLAAVYMPRGVFDHSIYAHDGPLPAPGTPERQAIDAGKGYKCEDCHAARTSDVATDLLIPDKGNCVDCHAPTVSKPKAIKAETACVECHSFHKPGRASPKPGHPPLESLRWKEADARRAPAG